MLIFALENVPMFILLCRRDKKPLTSKDEKWTQITWGKDNCFLL